MSEAIVHSLSRKLDDGAQDRLSLSNHYDGLQAVSFLHEDIRRQVGNRLHTVSINWHRVILDSIEERLDVEGFRSGGEAADAGLWSLWESSDLDEWSQMGHLDALLYGQSYAIVWRDRDGLQISVESPDEVSVDVAPGPRGVIRSALKRWREDDHWRASLYLPDRVEMYRTQPMSSSSGNTPPRSPDAWVRYDTVTHSAGVVPVVTFTNKPRTAALAGRSEIADLLSPVAAISKLATDMMVTSEFHAMPRRYATGIQVATSADPAERERLQAEAAAYWDQATKTKTWLAGTGVEFGQFPTADLSNFVNAINHLTGQVAAIAGLPPHYLGVSGSDNPASADAIRSAEASLVKRAKRKQRQFGGSWERAMQIAKALELGVRVIDLPESYRKVETIWRDPETPTVAQSADAALKLVQGQVITGETAQEVYLGFSPEQIEQDRRRRLSAAADLALAPVRAQVDLSDELQGRGLTQNAALAASGLTIAAGLNRAEGAA